MTGVISCLCRQINSAILLSSAVLVRLFSPLECSGMLYAGAVVLCAGLLVLCQWLWLRIITVT